MISLIRRKPAAAAEMEIAKRKQQWYEFQMASEMKTEENDYCNVQERARALVALKEDRASDAWDNLIEAQGHVSTAIKSHDNFRYLEKYADKLSAIEQLLFPPQTFCSPGMIVKESECSICKQDYGECDHVKGRAYMGELCVRIITKAELREISLVKEPANKHARALHFSEKEGNRDIITWRIKKETKEEPILSEREVEVALPPLNSLG
jgi:hypothetical protein